MDLEWRAVLLMEIFPDTAFETAMQYLKENDGDVDRATECILSENLILAAHKDWIVQEGGEVEMQKFEEADNGLSLDEERLMEVTRLSLDEVKMYLDKNGHNVPETLIDIVVAYEEQYRENLMRFEQRKMARKKKNQRTTTSRVQADYTKKSNKNRESPKDDNIGKPTYIFHPANSEVRELSDIVFSEPDLVGINWNFYIDLLVFCHGDLSRVVEMAIFVFEQDAVQLTFLNKRYASMLNESESSSSLSRDNVVDYSKLPNRPLDAENDFQTVKSKRRNRFPICTPPTTPISSPSSSSQISKSYDRLGLQENQEQLLLRGLRLARENNVLDLHGFHTDTAKRAVGLVLAQWWADELHTRSLEGTEGSTVNARHVEALNIITGKGIHSERGISKVRLQVRSLLEKSPYKYHEDSASFLVYGKKL